MRTALLQLPGNPLTLAYFLRNYRQVWKGEMDELRVLVNGCGDASVLEADRRLVEEAGGVFEEPVPDRLVHGDAARRMLEGLPERDDPDVAMLVEDDAYVRVVGAVRYAAELAERGFVVGSPRGGMSPVVEAAARERWGEDPVGPDGSVGYGLWPCFLFAPTRALREVSHLICSRSWAPGEEVAGLGRSFDEVVTTDTMTAAAFVLRERFPLAYEGQWKELWLRDLEAARDRVLYDPPWLHAGGLSNEDVFNGGDFLGHRPGIGGSNEGNDWAHRIWWWRRIATTQASVHPELAEHFLRELDRLVSYLDVRAEVEAWDSEEEWISWDDGGN